MTQKEKDSHEGTKGTKKRNLFVFFVPSWRSVLRG